MFHHLSAFPSNYREGRDTSRSASNSTVISKDLRDWFLSVIYHRQKGVIRMGDLKEMLSNWLRNQRSTKVKYDTLYI